MSYKHFILSLALAGSFFAGSSVFAGTSTLACQPDAFQFKVTNKQSKPVPASAKVTITITPMRVQGVDPKTVRTKFEETLKGELAPGGETTFPGSGFAKACTARANW
jgi:hypothetical protein